MNVKNCPRCGKLFIPKVNDICNTCMKEEEEEFAKVKDYLYEHPGAILQEVADATNVSTDKILRYLREGRLTLTSNHTNLLLNCESCDRPILTGRYCESCKSKLADEFSKHLRDSDKRRIFGNSQGSRMFTANRRKK